MVTLRTAGALCFALAAALVSADSQTTCSPSKQCPQDSPCCSSYGVCGVGAYCLGGCDPRSSFNLQSCMPNPVCQSSDYKFTSLDGIAPNTQYLGDATKANWVSSGNPQAYGGQNGQGASVLLTMAPNTVGTLLSSTHYVWYGKISATMTTSQGPGVVTAFIMMSDMKDEIDFEFVGVDLEHAQSNYYFQGITDYHNELNLTTTNTVQNTHTYEIDWTPDSLTWSIDGVALRTLDKNSTYNSTDKQYHYPQTPARVQLSLWPAGLSSNAQGTIDWSGGLISWNSPYMVNGYYYAQVYDVNVECYNPPSDAQVDGSKAYVYTNEIGTEQYVAITNNNTVLASFQADGLDQNVNPSSASGSPGATATSNANTVPGMSGAGSYGNGASSSSDGSSSGGSSGSSGGNNGGTSFDQGTPSGNEGVRVVAGSLVALVAFFAALMMI